MSTSARQIASPAVNPETEAFWAAANDGRLMIGHCSHCNTNHWYPRAQCPNCWKPNATLVEASGRGKIYSFTVMRRVVQPYAVAYVTLAEGPTMLSNIVDCDLDRLAIGQDVTVTFAASAEGQKVPMFRPA